MAYYKVLTAAIAVGESVTDPICVLEYPQVSLEIPTFAVGCASASANIQIEGSSTATTSEFRTVRHMGVYSGGSGIMTWEVPYGTGNYIATCEPASYFRYIRVRMPVNTATAAGLGVQVHLYRNPQ